METVRLKMLLARVWLLMVAGLLLIFISCGGDRITEGDNINPSPDPTGPINPGTGNYGGGSDEDLSGCLNEKYTQVPTSTKRIDILIIVDTSGSMGDELKVVGEQFAAFINVLKTAEPDLDYQVAVMLAHAESPQSGILWQPGACTNPPVIHGGPGIDYATSVEAPLRCKLTHFVQAAESESKGEAGITAIIKATGSNLSHFKSNGFFRENTALSVIFVADENDICHAPPGYKESDGAEAVFRKSGKCNGITPSIAYSQMKSVLGVQPLTLAGLVNTNVKSSNYGWGYLGEVSNLGYPGVVNLAGGDGIATQISQTPSQVASALSSISKKVNHSLKTKDTFEVRSSVVRIESVHVAGKEVAFQYNPGTHVVTITTSDAGGAGDMISIRSCSK